MCERQRSTERHHLVRRRRHHVLHQVRDGQAGRERKARRAVEVNAIAAARTTRHTRATGAQLGATLRRHADVCRRGGSVGLAGAASSDRHVGVGPIAAVAQRRGVDSRRQHGARDVGIVRVHPQVGEPRRLVHRCRQAELPVVISRGAGSCSYVARVGLHRQRDHGGRNLRQQRQPGPYVRVARGKTLRRRHASPHAARGGGITCAHTPSIAHVVAYHVRAWATHTQGQRSMHARDAMGSYQRRTGRWASARKQRSTAQTCGRTRPTSIAACPSPCRRTRHQCPRSTGSPVASRAARA